MNADRLLAHYERIADAPDAIARLHRFILDLAVRGKLVAQDPNDEPAWELLKRIAKEKARLVKAGGIREIKPVAILAHAEDKVPAGWQLVPLGEVINSHLGGGTPSKSNFAYWNGDIRWASVKDVGKQKYLDETIDRITEEGLANSSSNLIPEGNLIVVTRMGLGQLSINRVPVAINQDLRALFLSRFVDIEYVYNFFLTYGMEGTGLTVKGIKIEELLGIPFPLPPLAEQHRIVAKVDELMGLCNRLEAARSGREAVRDRLTAASLARLNAPDPETFQDDARFALDALPALTTRPDQIKRLRQAILNLAVRGKLVPQDPNDEPASELLKRIAKEKAKSTGRNKFLPEIEDAEKTFDAPENWRWVRMGNVFSIRTGFAFKSSTYVDKGTLVFRVTNFDRDGSFDLSDVVFFPTEQIDSRMSGFLMEPDEIIMVMVGGTIGKTTIVDESILPALLNQNMWRIRSFGGVMSSKFEYLLVKNINQSIQGLTQSTHGHFTMSDYEKRVFPLPPLAEQHRIVAKVDALMALCDRLEASLTATAATRRRLLDALLAEALAPSPARELEAAE